MGGMGLGKSSRTPREVILQASKQTIVFPMNNSSPSLFKPTKNLKNEAQAASNILPSIAKIQLVNSHPEVYDPSDDSFILVDSLLADRSRIIEQKPIICLEIGCGSGYVITSLALMLRDELPGAKFFATDINLHAVSTTQLTLEAHGVNAEVVATDIVSGLQRRLTGLVDLVVVNPPYVPTPEEEVGCSGITASWAGGENGRRVIDRILPAVDRLLSEKGWLYLVTVAENNPLEICREMREKGYVSKILLQRSTQEERLQVIKFWREVNRGRSSWSSNCFLS